MEREYIYDHEEDTCADIVISGRIFDENGKSRNGALAIRDGRYMAIGDCDEISQHIGLETIMCGYKNKSVLAGLYSTATGIEVEEMGNNYRTEGNYQIITDGRMTMKPGEPANLVVYDEQAEDYSESIFRNAKVLLKIVDGKIVYRKKERVKKAAFSI
ncbi:MAG: hypothetical protein ACI4BB_08910 [Coprococcus sp.]